jgi:GDPmannose 4,6-dehydratase
MLSMKKIALITGSSGQDGSYLSQFLLKKNYIVVCADRRSSRSDNWRHKYLGINNQLIYEDFDMQEHESISSLFKKYKFNEVYNLAAQSFVKSSFNVPIITTEVNALGALRILEVIRQSKSKIKFYQASSSEMFGNSNTKNEKTQNENTSFNPQSPYAVSKCFAHYITKNYRDSYNIFACSGILFNHESPLRGEEFVTKKIVKTLVQIKKGSESFLELGNLYAKRDWGYAKDYVECIWKILNYKRPDDYIISTNKCYTVKEFVDICCAKLNLKIKWVGKNLKEKAINLETNKIIIKINKLLYRPSEVNFLKGNCSKAEKILKWKPKKTSIKKLIDIMINFELQNSK